jgi:hypothetical protein
MHVSIHLSKYIKCATPKRVYPHVNYELLVTMYPSKFSILKQMYYPDEELGNERSYMGEGDWKYMEILYKFCSVLQQT